MVQNSRGIRTEDVVMLNLFSIKWKNCVKSYFKMKVNNWMLENEEFAIFSM